MYYSRFLNHRVYQQPKIFPLDHKVDNLVICTSASVNDGISVLMTDNIPNLHFNGDSQCFPMYYFEENNQTTPTLFDGDAKTGLNKRDGISDDFAALINEKFNNNKITKEEIFYYIYGVLHSRDYRIEFENDLKKMLPRVPLVDSEEDFRSFSKSGKELAKLHVNYENVEPYENVKVSGTQHNNYKIQKMKFAKKGQKSKIIFNAQITIENIPDKAYEYTINGKSAVEWIIDRYQIKIDKKSGIINDPNEWVKEVGNPRYVLDLLLSIINVSVQTVDIVNKLPKLEFSEKES
jgi:predicted helicase